MKPPRIGQVALVVSDWKRSAALYAGAFGLDHVFGTCAFRGETTARIQGIPGAASSTRAASGQATSTSALTGVKDDVAVLVHSDCAAAHASTQGHWVRIPR